MAGAGPALGLLALRPLLRDETTQPKQAISPSPAQQSMGQNQPPWIHSIELQHTLELAFHRAPVGLCVSRHRMIEICNGPLRRCSGMRRPISWAIPGPAVPSLDEFAHIGKLGLPVMQATGTYSDERIMCRSDGALFWCHVAGCALDRADPLPMPCGCSRTFHSGARSAPR